METADYLEILHKGGITMRGQFMYGSNYTFFVDVEFGAEKLKAVYKPLRGEQLLWDFPAKSLAGREVAVWMVSQALGWHFVPPTVLRRSKAPLGAGSLQLFIEHDPEQHYFTFDDETKQSLRPVVLFDLVVNNADRKGGHLLIDPPGKLWAIDHGLCFHVEDKLRTVIWDFAGDPIPQELLSDLVRFKAQLQEDETLRHDLLDYLKQGELDAITKRIGVLEENSTFPQPSRDRRAFPWPPV